MNRPPFSHNIMGKMYRGPRPNNNQWRPPGPFPQMGFQGRPNRHFRPPLKSSSNERNEEHWCETCDRGFPTANILGQHKQQHQKCNIDGCQFVAHPKVITKHIQMQHSSGLYKKIAKLNNPEEINKWREERKKKYPTIINIEKKAAECKEKIERGEKMGLKRDWKDNHNRPKDQGAGFKRRHNFDKSNQNHRNNRANTNQKQHYGANNIDPPAKKVPKTVPKVPGVIQNNKLKPFAGISSINMHDDNKVDVNITTDCNNILIEDDYYEEPISVESPEPKSATEPALCGALTSLVCDYGSSDEEPDEKESKVPSIIRTSENIKTEAKSNVKKDSYIVANNVNIIGVPAVNNKQNDVESVNNDYLIDADQNVKMKPQVNDANSDDDGPEEVKTKKSNAEDPRFSKDKTCNNTKQPVSVKKNNPCRNNNNNNHRQNNRFKNKVPSTLLYKLLNKEIRQERNIVLQCIRYIKKMSYFEKDC